MIRARRAVAILLLTHNFPARSAAGFEDDTVETEGPTVFRLREEQGEEVTAFSTYKGDLHRTLLLDPDLASVLRTTPSRPKAQPFSGSGKSRAKRLRLSPLTKETSTGLFCLIQFLPPFRVWKMTPNSPTIHPLLGLTNATSLKVRSSDSDELIHERPPSCV